jgi:hypothetical protein
MKSVVIGTRSYHCKGNDIDLLADQDYVDMLTERWGESHQKIENPTGVTYVWKHERPLEYDFQLWKSVFSQLWASSTLVILAGNKYFLGDAKIFEVKVPNPGTAHRLVLNAGGHDYSRGEAGIPILCALKKAHLVHPKKWHHHIKEYRYLKDEWLLLAGKPFVPSDYGPLTDKIYKLHRKEILAIAKPHPKLNTKKSQFFEDAEFKIFDHDTIHEAVALGKVPAYTLMNDGEVWVSRKKWRKMTEKQRFNCVVEEASVLALERAIIPSLYLNKVRYRGAKWAFEYAMFKICTTITSGWFRDYCIEQYWKAVENRPDFINAFFEGFKSGQVKVLKPEIVYG